jgi:hypothetical protein
LRPLRDLLRRKKKPPKVTISAVVIRADGTREELGVISEGHVLFAPKGDPNGKDQG